MNAVLKVTIPNVSALLSSAFIRGDLNCYAGYHKQTMFDGPPWLLRKLSSIRVYKSQICGPHLVVI